jgi:capsular exopolysaccharide synthesis family protein
MSRIQNILNKAERDGTVRRMQTAADPVVATGVATLDDAATLAAPVSRLNHDIGVRAAPVVPAATPAHAITAAPIDPRLVVALPVESATAEQYRALRTRIVHADTGGPVNVLLVTSPGRGEGKTLTAANLALTMAQEYQQRICVVDADLRHRQIHRLFGLPDAPGLADVLAGRASLEEALVTVESHHITVLPAGGAGAHPAELLGTVTMRRLLDTLRSQFDRIVIDAPSAAPLADVGILTPLVDSVLLVVRAGVTSKPAIQEAIHSIDQAKLLGVVLNQAA